MRENTIRATRRTWQKKKLKTLFCSGHTEKIKGADVDKNTEENYDYLLVLDFEATCAKETKIVQEIIEFPCLKVNATTFQEESRFHYYVKPVLNPILTAFCKGLTGIEQKIVDSSEEFPTVLGYFEKWREAENLTDKNSIYITSGDWDLGIMIPRQCEISDLEIPQHMSQWIDLKKMYGNNFNCYYNSFAEIMKTFNFQFIGRQHSGIDDCLNMLRIVQKFGNLGLQFKHTSKLVHDDSRWHVEVVGSRKFVHPTIWHKKTLGSQKESNKTLSK